MRDVIDELLPWWAAGSTVGMGTVVGTWKSAPRQPGAAMLVGLASFYVAYALVVGAAVVALALLGGLSRRWLVPAAAPSDTAPVPRFKSFVPVKLKSPFQT